MYVSFLKKTRRQDRRCAEHDFMTLFLSFYNKAPMLEMPIFQVAQIENEYFLHF